MTRDQVNAVLRQMEHVRELSYEAESVREERRLAKEYRVLWQTIEAYVTGHRPYSERPAHD